MLLRHAIGQVLRRIRTEQGLTLRDVATAAAISTPYLSEIERGRKEPSSEVLATVLRVLGLSLVDLLDETRADTLRAMTVVDLISRRTQSVGNELRSGNVLRPHGSTAEVHALALVG